VADRDEPIDFADLAAALLDRAEQLVAQWLPGGKRAGAEYVCADLNGGEGRSFSVNLITGLWADFSGDESGGDLISLYAAIHNLNQGQAARELMRDMGWQRGPATAAPAQRNDAARPPRDDDQAAAPAAKRRSMWRALVPVPATAPDPTFKHFERGLPERHWLYEFEGQRYGYVCRFLTSDGGKEILPYTWCVDESDDRGSMRWHWKQWEEPRPLYVPAALLSADCSLPVVLVEGEKCAQAGHQLLGHEFDFVSWPGGSKAWPKCGWGWLMGRTVYLWPDCDAQRVRLTREEREAGVDPATKPLLPEAKQPGMAAMVGIGSLLAADQGCTVFLCPVPAPGAVSDGWDIADAIAQGWGPEEVRAFIRGARVFVPPDDSARTKAAVGASTPSIAGAGTDEAARAWRSGLVLNKDGGTRVVRENVVVALDGLPSAGVPGIPEAADVLAWNEFTSDVVKLKASPWGTPAGAWDEVDDLLMGEWLVREHWLPSMPRGTLEEAVRMVAYRHRYHPVRQYLQGLRWDGTKRLPGWLRRACLEDDEIDADLQAYLERAGTFYLMGMVQRVLRPGCKFDYMLVLESPEQGKGKSSLFRLLAGDWFADTGLVLGDKDSYQQLQGRWLYEMGELDSLSRADVRQVKMYIASQSDYFRASFDRRAREFPRQVVFGGTTNDDHYLVDPTGNRRFWPVRVNRGTGVDLAWVAEVRDQLFAEAVARLAAGKRWYPLPDEEARLFAPQQQLRMVENAIEVKVASYLHPRGNPSGPQSDGVLIEEISVVDLLGKIGIGVEKLTPARFHEKQASTALRRLGWHEGRSSGPGRPRVFRRPRGGPPAGIDSAHKRPTQGDQPEGADDGCPF
jgi:putative DNA primase/helicase